MHQIRYPFLTEVGKIRHNSNKGKYFKKKKTYEGTETGVIAIHPFAQLSIFYSSDFN